MFKTMTGVLNPKNNFSDEEIEKIPSFIFCRWLSGNPYSIVASNQINYYFNIPILNQYNMIRTAFAGKIKFIPYPKSDSSADLKHTEYLSEYFKISNEKAKEYLEFISDDELKLIIDIYESKR